MTQHPIDHMLSRVLVGDLSDRPQGFLLTLPKGHKLTARLDGHFQAAYGAEQHPDIRRLLPEGAGRFITVEAIRDAGNFLVSSPGGDGMKTLIILEAERMNENAANALLKPLEEPTEHTRIILVTDQPGSLLPTIRSRCITLSAPYSEADAHVEISSLAAAADIELDEKRIANLLAMSDGDPSLALALEQQGLVSWIEALPKWLVKSGGQRTPRPLPKSLGTKAGPDLLPAALGLQAFLVRASRGDAPGISQDWPADRIQRACWSVMELMDDIQRTGIDAKTRLTVLMDTVANTPIRVTS